MKRAEYRTLILLITTSFACGGTDMAKSDEGAPVIDIIEEPDIAAPSDPGVLIEPDIQDPPVVFEEPEDVSAFCNEQNLKTKWFEIVIPPNETECPWGEEDNDEMQQSSTTARIEQVFPLNVPEDAVVCGLVFDFSESVGSEPKTLHYDDHFLLTMNGAVIIASRAAWVENFQEALGVRMYDWNDIKGESIGGGSQTPYCLGEAEGLTHCVVPDSDEEGVIELELDQSLTTKLGFLGFYAQAHAFNFITTGDNDPETDCNHSELLFRVLVKYAEK